MKKTKIIVFVIVLMIIIFGLYCFFNKNNYKNIKIGNNNLKSAEDIKEYILNISSYEATVSIEVKSNKNENKYIVKQQYENPNIFKQEVLEPENIKGLKMIYDGNTLKLENTKLNLSKLYENYKYVSENSLCLYNFIENYIKNDKSTCKEEKNQIILETRLENTNNKYLVNKKLYIDKSTAKPTKMEIQDINQNTTVYILYNEIKINSTNKEEILAFKLKTIESNI